MTRIIVPGRANGIVLKTTNPINFLGAVDKKTGIIHDQKCDIFKKSIKNTILVFHHGWTSPFPLYDNLNSFLTIQHIVFLFSMN